LAAARHGKHGIRPRPVGNFQTFGGDGSELFTQKTIGGSVSFSTPLTYFFKRSTIARFSRLGLSYTYRRSEIEDPPSTPTTIRRTTFSSPSVSLESTSRRSHRPSRTTRSMDRSTRRGDNRSSRASLCPADFSAGRQHDQPTLEYKFFHPFNIIRKDRENPDVFGMRFWRTHPRVWRAAGYELALVRRRTPIYTRYFLGARIRSADTTSDHCRRSPASSDWLRLRTSSLSTPATARLCAL